MLLQELKDPIKTILNIFKTEITPEKLAMVQYISPSPEKWNSICEYSIVN